MQMKKDTDLALRVMLCLSQAFPKPRNIVEIGRQARIPKGYVQQVLTTLADYGLVTRVQKSRHDARYCIMARPEDIDLYDIACAVGDQVCLDAVFNKTVSQYSLYGKVLADLSGKFEMDLRSVSLADLMGDEKERE